MSEVADASSRWTGLGPATGPACIPSLLRCWRGDLQQGLLHDFSEGRVDVERVVGKLVDRLPKAHGVDERLQQDGGAARRDAPPTPGAFRREQ